MSNLDSYASGLELQMIHSRGFAATTLGVKPYSRRNAHMQILQEPHHWPQNDEISSSGAFGSEALHSPH